MGNNLYFVISSVVLSLTLLASYYLCYRIPTKDNKMLAILIWVLTGSNILDLVMGLNGLYYHLPGKTFYLMNICYLIGRQAIIVGYTAYLVVSTNSKRVIPLWWKVLCSITNLYGLILLIGNIKFHWIFYMDSHDNYARGEYMFLYYIYVICYMLFCIWHLICHGHVLDWSKRVALSVFIIIPVLGALLQYLLPGFLIEGFALTLGMLWIYLNVPKTNRMLDSDTSALNQYAFSCKIDTILRQGTESYVALIRFRDKNSLHDKYGLEAYKKLMREVTYELCKRNGRDQVYYLRDARYAVTIEASSEKDALEKSNNLLGALQRTWRIYGNDIEVWVVGVLLDLPDDADDINDIYSYLAYLEIMPSLHGNTMYEGKHLDVAYMKRYDEIERAIERALQKTNFEVYYQPIYSTVEKRVVAAEALLRMYDEEMGFISPEEFIPIAEKNGKIIEIGKMVLESVCRFLQEENIREYGLHYIEVNLSIVECMQDMLPSEIGRILDQYGVEPQLLNLEITETALARNQSVLAENMHKISEMGVSFSLDDYGTGYSTITYMMTLPFKIVKIDKSILWSSFENERAMIALCSSINMIKDMNMEIVVEGVETKEMADKLTQLGCDYLQGYYYSKPLSKKDFVEFIAKKE